MTARRARSAILTLSFFYLSLSLSFSRSEDYAPCATFSAAFIVDTPSLGIVVADDRRNLQLLQVQSNPM